MKDRIYSIMKNSGMNQKEFSQATGIATATLSNIFNGRTSATLNHAKAIHQRFPEIRIEWLLFGEGEMHASATTPEGSLRDNRGGQPTGDSSAPTLFDLAPATPSVGGGQPKAEICVQTIVETVKEAVRQIEKPQRNIVEIRIFFDDGTYDVFQANRP